MLFLDIPRKNLLSIFKKCDTFLKFCSNFTLDKKLQKKLILMSSDEEDEFDKNINKKLNQIKKKNNQTNNYYYYLVSRKSIIDIFRKSKNKELKVISFLLLIVLCSLVFGFISMIDFSNVNHQISFFTSYEFNKKLVLSQYAICLTLCREIFISPNFIVNHKPLRKFTESCIKDSVDMHLDLYNFDAQFASTKESLRDLYSRFNYKSVCLFDKDVSRQFRCMHQIFEILNHGLINFEIHIHDKLIEYNSTLWDI